MDLFFGLWPGRFWLNSLRHQSVNHRLRLERIWSRLISAVQFRLLKLWPFGTFLLLFSLNLLMWRRGRSRRGGVGRVVQDMALVMWWRRGGQQVCVQHRYLELARIWSGG
jgi:hypothetical protein